jgi:DUF1680 family protein
MASADEVDDGLAAVAYAPCEVKTTLRGTPIHLTQQTSYPFHGTIRIAVNPATPLAFPLSLRIPAWATGATLRVNGQPQPTPAPGTFARIDRKWSTGDQVELTLPMEPRLIPGFHNSVSVHRGPLLFSFAIGESWVKLRDRGLTADWQIYPTQPWNYALAATTSQDFSTQQAELGQLPFTARHKPVRLQVKARKLPEWRAEDGVANPLPQSPVNSTEPVETITLIPYAAAKLRISAFPNLKQTN